MEVLMVSGVNLLFFQRAIGSKLVLVLAVLLSLIGCDQKSDSEEVWRQQNISENLLLLEKKPNNCFILDQLASGYMIDKQYQKALSYFKKVMNNCPGDYSKRFQMGICYLFINDVDKATLAMNKAISDAKAKGDVKWVNGFTTEKKLWLQAWDSGKFQKDKKP